MSIRSVLETVLPYRKPDSLIPEILRQAYPYFYQIYDQATEAETHGLDKISGMAYRKALEILVKQYLIKQIPNEEEHILKESLGKSIDRIPLESIRNLAKAISWIGNDQTHMLQRHPDYKVPEMKRFMSALCHLITLEQIAAEAAAFVSS